MPSKVEKEAWNDDHTRELLRAMIRTILMNRPGIYGLPGLQGVSDNRGDRINKKIKQTLNKLCDGYPDINTKGLVDEEVKNMGKVKVGNGTPSPKKNGGGGGSANGTPKKRKVKEESDEE